MAIEPGQRFGAYEIQSVIGVGGMGEVYRARDTRLDRIVAIKILPDRLAGMPDVRERFEREAKTIASLNHPHICVLHDVGVEHGTPYLVMEYLEGETLAQRLRKGALPLDQLFPYAIEIADALDKAHRKGVTHRDLKPGNVVLTKSGAKLLDFGLAKLKQQGVSAAAAQTVMATQEPITAHGTILGTLQYMAPEQLDGRDIDCRADIFALGAVLYEMVTGVRAFEGKSQASVIGKILETDPPSIASLQPLTPPALDRLVRKCLKKDPDDRWQSARDVADELKWIAEDGSHPIAGTRRSALGGTRLAWGTAAIAIAVAAGVAGVAYFRAAPAAPGLVRFAIEPPENTSFESDVSPTFLSVSPDGTKVAFRVNDAAGAGQIWIRALDEAVAQPVRGTERGFAPFWSPDSRFLAFFADQSLKKITVSGGPAQTLLQGAGVLGGGAWGAENVLLFAPSANQGGPIQRVGASGGQARGATAFDAAPPAAAHLSPDFLPDGRHFVFYARGVNPEQSAIFAGSLDSEERTLLLNVSSNVAYVAPGYLVYHRGGTLMAHPFDADRLQFTAEPIPVAEALQFNQGTGMAAFAASSSVLAYRAGSTTPRRNLVWVSRDGRERALTQTHFYQQPRLSPDGRRLVVELDDRENHVWLYDLDPEKLTRITFDATQNETPIWTPDGERIAFYSNRGGQVTSIYWQRADGTGGVERLTTSNFNDVPMSFSPDGQQLAFTRSDPRTGRDIWVLRLADRKAEPFLATPFLEGGASFSPDGRWLAYVSNESGRPEIYVRPFPGPSAKWLISTEGGTEPVWNPRGGELFYRAGNRMMVVEVGTDPSFYARTPRVLFERPYVFTPIPQTFPHYDVSRDGQRFLMVKQGAEFAAPINVIQNWLTGLRRPSTTGRN